MVPTFFGTTLLVYLIISYVPGGPFQKAVMELRSQQLQGSEVGGGGSTGVTESNKLPPEVLEKLKQQYGLDKPVLTRYLIWLGLYPRELKGKTVAIGEPFRENLEYIKENNRTYELQRWLIAEKEADGEIVIYDGGAGFDFALPSDAAYPDKDYYNVLPDVSEISGEWEETFDWKIASQEDGQIKLTQRAFSGIFQGDFGESYKHHEPVTKLIWDRMHISAYFGVLGFLLTYMVCIPLGIFKAIKNGSSFDILSSALIFMGFAVPGFVLGSVLLVLFGGGSFWDIFPLGGFRSPDFDAMSLAGKVKDQLYHTFLPVICYMVGSFATLTILMKNSLLENMSQDYVRTAFAKGLSEKTVIVGHAVRNSLIPIVARIGGVIGVFFAGSYLIEKVFNIHGIGLLSYNAIVDTDYPIFLGFVVIGIIIRVLGNLISDLCYLLVDPRIKLD